MCAQALPLVLLSCTLVSYALGALHSSVGALQYLLSAPLPITLTCHNEHSQHAGRQERCVEDETWRSDDDFVRKGARRSARTYWQEAYGQWVYNSFLASVDVREVICAKEWSGIVRWHSFAEKHVHSCLSTEMLITAERSESMRALVLSMNSSL